MAATTFVLELRPQIPAKLARLEELAGNLAYSWHRDIRAVFARLDPALWSACEGNPKLFLRRVAQQRLDQAAEDRDFLEDYRHALNSLDDCLGAAPRAEIAEYLEPGTDLVAYFCAEFGLHESLPIYSGGLGILAGDHCKAASDLGVPFVAVGLLYRQGYFTQTIDAQGRQHAHAHPSDFEELPLKPCLDAGGRELRVGVEIAERTVRVRLWEARVGKVPLYLLDADVAENDDADRAITCQLYGGDTDTRIRQELVLGIGGLRALRALGIEPTVFHMNEGHAAFLIGERLREQVAAGMDFDSALELVAAAHVFTTHTPVSSGHDVFHNSQVRHNLMRLFPQLGVRDERLLALGSTDMGSDPNQGRFNMTTFALRGSRSHNGVSKIHGRVARRMEKHLWPQLLNREVPIRHVTNGVHMHTFLAEAWARLFHERFSEWREHLIDPAFWKRIDTIPHERFVAVRRALKAEMLRELASRVRRQMRRNDVPETIIGRTLRHVAQADASTLVLGFARRFATYKRATLLLSDEARLARILNDPQYPAILVFAGKAHPRDLPAQALIQRLYETSQKPDFIGRLLVLEGYDMWLARHLVRGCDVWLNNPEYPLEASGTSGEKAGINGVVNVSVLDGWWDEGYVREGADGPNGFAVEPVDPKFWGHLQNDEEARRRRDDEECRQLLDILEYQVAPTYYGADRAGYAPEWIHIAKNSMKTLIPRYNSARMVMDYVRDFYGPAARQGRKLAANDGAEARALATWKRKVRAAWPQAQIRVVESPPRSAPQGTAVKIVTRARIEGLEPTDVAVECLIGDHEGSGRFSAKHTIPLIAGSSGPGDVMFSAEFVPPPGLQQLRVRMRPVHALLTHPLELGLAVWA
jgi:starch phosphorylase